MERETFLEVLKKENESLKIENKRLKDENALLFQKLKQDRQYLEVDNNHVAMLYEELDKLRTENTELILINADQAKYIAELYKR